ncbi:MAG: rhomboid family intramembrane serine protease [Dehalococcoidia bacterium]|nr:rhomboid family intramembrane serine protease [Dehalococcoidia bacterium]
MRDYRSPNPTGVLILILINVVVFIFTLLSNSLEYRLDLQPAYFTEEPWTILTSMFVHAGFFHILGNMITLYFFGTYLTMLVGEVKFLIIYFVGGLVGGAFYIIYALYAPWASETARYAGVVGASGAVFAVGTALAVLRPNIKALLYFIIPVPLWIVIVGSFLLLSFIPNVAWQAHLGGLVVGLIAGLLLIRRPKPRDRYLL